MNRFFIYISESRAELTKVNWPSRKAAVNFTLAVVAFALIMAVFIGAVDYVFSTGLQRLIIKG